MSHATQRQPAPLPGGRPALPLVRTRYGRCHPAIVRDIEARAKVGMETYGVEGVHVPDGRDHGVDAYQELLDAAHYLIARSMAAEGPTRARWLALADQTVGLATVVEGSITRPP